MNKFFAKIAGITAGLALVASAGVALASHAEVKGAKADAATMAPGTNGSACTVNGKDGIKVGTSKKGGDMTITVGSGATSLSFYAAAWKGANVSLNLTMTVGSAATTSFALTADNGVSNNSPFTLSGTESSYLFTTDLSGVTSESVITLATSTTKRFVIWNATYEVGGGEQGDTYDVVDSVEHGSLDKTSVKEGATLNATITPDDNYAVPDSVSVTMGGSSTPFTYNNGVVTVENVTGDVEISGSCIKANPIQALYSKAKGATISGFYGYYVGFATGSGPIVMDGAWGMMLYNSSQDVSGWTEGETIIHVTAGTIDVYNGLYEVKSYTCETVESADISAPVTHTTTGDESAQEANRLTNASGKVAAAPTKGNFTQEPGASDVQFTYTVGSKTFTVYYKKAAQTSEVLAVLADSLENETEITIKGFTSWYNAFQVTMTGIVAAAEGYTAEDFAQDLLDQTDAVCGGYKEGDNNKTALEAVWSDLQGVTKYPALPAEEKQALAEADADASGNVVERALARYEFLCVKYGLGQFINGHDNIPVGRYVVPGTTTIDSNVAVAVVAIVAIASISAIAVVLVIKRRRALEK